MPAAVHARHPRLRPLIGFRHRLPAYRAPRLLAPGPPDENLPPPVGEPSPLTEDQLNGGVPAPHGFIVTVRVGGSDRPARATSLGRFVEVGPALGACWTPPPDLPWNAITMRVAFRRDGTVYGVPRIPFVGAASADAKTRLAESLLAALKTCTPLPFSPSLGSPVAGEIFAIRFVNQEQQ